MGDVLNVDTVFNKYKNKVYHLALGITKNEKDAEDVLQNSFIKIIRNLDSFRSESRLSTWIYRIAYNEALMLLRKRYRQSRLSKEFKNSRPETVRGLFINWPKLPSEQLLDKEFQERAEAAIRDMPIKYRMPLLLHHIENLPVKNAALVLGLKPSSFKTRLHRSYMILRDEISSYFKDRLEERKNSDPKCGAWTSFAYDYITKSLKQVRYSAFNKHIEDCPNCRSFLNTYSQAVRITNAMQCHDIPSELRTKIETFLFHGHLNNGKRKG